MTLFIRAGVTVADVQTGMPMTLIADAHVDDAEACTFDGVVVAYHYPVGDRTYEVAVEDVAVAS